MQYNSTLLVVLLGSEQKIPIMLPVHMFLKVLAVDIKLVTERALYVLNLSKHLTYKLFFGIKMFSAKNIS